MKAQFATAAATLAAIAMMSGCMSEVLVAEIPSTTQAGASVDGIPFRVARRFDALIYEKTDNGYELVGEKPITVPDPNHLYVVNFQSQFFANPTFELKINKDSTLKEVALKSKASGSAAVKELGAQLNAVAKSRAELDKAETTAMGAGADLKIALASAKAEARIADAEYAILRDKPDASPVELLKAEQKQRDAELKANKAALLAGEPLPHPNTLP